MYTNQIIGKQGEDLSCKYIQKLGYKIIERNFNCNYGEIDIIALDKKELVFIEVKTRTSLNYGNPADAVDYKKQKHLYKACKYYLYERNLENEFVRVDIIEVYIAKDSTKINHIKSIVF